MELGAFLRRSGFSLQNSSPKNLRGFTLIELLIVIGVVAVLATITLLVLNPAEMLKQGRDGTRISDIETLSRSVSFAIAQNPSIGMGEANKVYISLPDKNSDGICDVSDYSSLEMLPNPWSYKCVSLDDLRKNDGTGWIPINFRSLAVSPLERLPVDPVNTADEKLYYVYIPGYELNAKLESVKYSSGGARDVESNDGGDVSGIFEKGTELTSIPSSVSGIVVNEFSSAASAGQVLNLSWSHQVSAGSDRLLLIGISLQNQLFGTSVSQVTFGGNLLSKAYGVNQVNPFGGRIASEIWYLKNPPIGTQNIVVNISTIANIAASAVSLNGVDQMSTFGNNSSISNPSGGNAFLTISTLVDRARVFDVLTTFPGRVIGPTTGQDIYMNLGSSPDVLGGFGSKEVVSAGPTNVAWSISPNSNFLYIAQVVNPAP